RQPNRATHMKSHNTVREYPFPCGLCDRKFTRRTDLSRHHKSVHLKEKTFACFYCDQAFSRKDTRTR
ncbi:hypothetical protein QBC38DRAFT_348433, partial [Podospora fimiseda]